jgi:hypothetical protein
MRRPRAIEALVATSAAFVGGAILGLLAPPPRRSDPIPADPEVRLDAAAIDQHDVADAEADADASETGRDFTIEDLDPLPPEAISSTDPDLLLSLIPLTVRDDDSLAAARRFLGPGRSHGNQGNPAIARHEIDRATCIAGLRGTVLQTAEQREICGAPWEVPIHRGDPSAANVCIDAFEYPGVPCALPIVYVAPWAAQKLCALAGKRLCTQEEWQVACEADPAGGPPRRYAYGDELDLEICHTGRRKASQCDVDNALWKSCPTDTAPAGSFPRCRSRLGVFDQHGNVAEAMSRREDQVVYVQLKGSAWFYDGVMYADHCRFDPRWHVDRLAESWHVNYHLGFRCCRDVVPLAERLRGSAPVPP